MKKKLILSLCIVMAIIIGLYTVPAFAVSYDCDVRISSRAIMLVNVETDTVVLEKNINEARYISYLAELMTFIVVCDHITDLENTQIRITQSSLDKATTPDGILSAHVGESMSALDLLYCMMLPKGEDAAYVLADYVGKGSIPGFVTLMNNKAKTLRCTKTNFIAPGMSESTAQHSTCSDLYRIMKCAMEFDSFLKVTGTYAYTPKQFSPEEQLLNKNSLIRPTSPYFFKWVNGGKFGYDKVCGANVAATCKYNNVSYVCIALGSGTNSEFNVYTDAKQTLTWAYTSLGNQSLIPANTIVKTIEAKSDWGDSDIDLTVSEQLYRTMPADFTKDKISYVFDLPETIVMPVFEGQIVGTAGVYYDGKYIEDIDLLALESDGISMTGDLENFFSAMYNTVLSVNPTEPATAADEQATQSTLGE